VLGGLLGWIAAFAGLAGWGLVLGLAATTSVIVLLGRSCWHPVVRSA
jgi:hypothetical protein